MKISIIGAGNMGGAIAKGIYAGTFFSSQERENNGDDFVIELTCADHSEALLKSIADNFPGINTTNNNLEAVENADIVLFAVKPWILPSVIAEVKESLDYSRQLIISIAAGVGTEQLHSMLAKDGSSLPGIIYLIPNIAVEVGEGVFTFTTQNATKEQIDIVYRIFNDLGMAKLVEERQMSAATALSSCGIAYVFRYIRAAIEGGVEMGFYPKDAQDIVVQTLKGAAQLLEVHQSHPEAEIDKVTTPGGITIKGLNAMEESGFTNAVIKGLKAGK